MLKKKNSNRLLDYEEICSKFNGELESNAYLLYRDLWRALNSDKAGKIGSSFADDLDVSDKTKEVLRDIVVNHNNSISVEIILKNFDKLEENAIIYRGKKITYKELFSKVYVYASALKKMGFKSGAQVPVFATNTPEFIALYLAINLIGAQINSMGEWFDKDYNLFLLDKTLSDYVFITDNIYEEIKDKIESSNVKNIVVLPIGASLPSLENGEKCNPYEEFDSKFGHSFEDKTEKIKAESRKNVISLSEFEAMETLKENVVCNSSLDDPAMISYTSGTTKPGVPKAVLHANRSYVTLSRFKDKDISGLANMEGKKVLCHIPVYTNMELATISDALYQGCKLCLEPFYSDKFFKYSIVMYKPHYSPGSEGAYLNLCKNLCYNPDFKNVMLEDFVAPCITGEELTPGSEKFINYVARKHKFGTKAVPSPISPVTVSIGGGTSENGGVFTTLFKSLREKLSLRKEPFGLLTLPFADVAVLDDDGKYCKPGVVGHLAINSPCNMIGYLYDETDYSDLQIKDKTKDIIAEDGKVWRDAGTVAALGRYNKKEVYIKGRNEYLICEYHEGNIKEHNKDLFDDYFDGSTIYEPLYKINDLVRKDTKNILTANVVEIDDEVIGKNWVIHVEFSPLSRKSKHEILKSLVFRLAKFYPESVLEKLYIRVHSFGEGFAVAPSGKRDLNALRNEGYTDKCMSVINLYNNYSYIPKHRDKKEHDRVLSLKK